MQRKAPPIQTNFFLFYRVKDDI